MVMLDKRVSFLKNWIEAEGETVVEIVPDEYIMGKFIVTLADDEREYLILNDEDADERTTEEIQGLLWAFNAEFIVDNSTLVLDRFGKDRKAVVKALKKMQEELCESCNPLILALIGGEKGLQSFAHEAMLVDGRGHFLAHYDGKEIELSNDFFAYRVN